MKNSLRKILFVLILLCSAFDIFAQQENGTQGQNQAQTVPPAAVADTNKPMRTTFTFLGGVVLATRLHYFGRTDNLKSTAYLPTVSFDFDSAHIYVSGTSVLINNKVRDFDYAGTIAEAGYRFGKYDHFSGNAYVNKFFYETSNLPQSALEEQVGVNLSQRTKYINFTATSSAAFSNERTDFFASLGVNHLYRKRFKNSVLLVTPTYVFNMGSQNFTTVNYKENAIALTGGEDVIFRENRKFKILDHEFSVPVVYALKHFIFIATPSYIRPQNLVNIPGYPFLSENGEKLFYVNLSAFYTFKSTRKGR